MVYIPICWQGSRVVFIPKAGRAQHGSIKDFSPIRLTSTILKILQRLVDRYIKEVALVASPRHPEQHTYQEAKSMDTALAEVVTEVEKGMTNRGLAMAILLDIDGAFNYSH